MIKINFWSFKKAVSFENFMGQIYLNYFYMKIIKFDKNGKGQTKSNGTSLALISMNDTLQMDG